MSGALLLRDALVVGGRGKPFMGWVRVRANRIEALGEGAAPTAAGDRVIDGRNRILIPGLVNTHAHSHSSLTRGSAEGMTLEPWLEAVIREQSRRPRRRRARAPRDAGPGRARVAACRYRPRVAGDAMSSRLIPL